MFIVNTIIMYHNTHNIYSKLPSPQVKFRLQGGEMYCILKYQTPYPKSFMIIPPWGYELLPLHPASPNAESPHSQSQLRHCAIIYYIYLCFVTGEKASE